MMMNSEARKRTQARVAAEPLVEKLAAVAHLAEVWDRKADREDACGNGFAAAVLHAQARELRAALSDQLSA